MNLDFEIENAEEIEFQKKLNAMNKCCGCGKILGYNSTVCADCRTKFKALGIPIQGEM